LKEGCRPFLHVGDILQIISRYAWLKALQKEKLPPDLQKNPDCLC
jgi:hypothetical protein